MKIWGPSYSVLNTEPFQTVQLFPVMILYTARLPNSTLYSSPAISKSGTDCHSDTAKLPSEWGPAQKPLACCCGDLPMGERQEQDTPLQTSLNSCLIQESIYYRRVYSFFRNVETAPAGSSQDNFGAAPAGYLQKTTLIASFFYLAIYLKMFLAILFFFFSFHNMISEFLKAPWLF